MNRTLEQKLKEQQAKLAILETNYKRATDGNLHAAASLIGNNIKRQKAAIKATEELIQMQTEIFASTEKKAR